MIDAESVQEGETEKDEKDELLREALDRFGICESAWSQDRKRYTDDTKFASGHQWHENDLTERKGRPSLVVDKLSQYIRQIVNDARQNRPGIKVSPVDGQGDVEAAKVFQGIIRHVEDRSNADIAYDTSLECAVRGGMGFLRVLTEYVDDGTFNQDLCIKRVRNPLTVWLDPDCQEPDGSDARYGFVTDDLPKDVYEDRYGDKTPVNFDSDKVKTSEWFGDNVRVAEYFYVEDEKKRLHLLEDGTITNDDEIALAEAEGIQIPPIKETREIPQPRVYWMRLNGAEVIEGPRKWPGRYIPLIPVWGNEVDIDGEVIHTGLIHGAKDAQRLYNYSRSAFAERVALAPKTPYIVAEGQIEEHKTEWDTANVKNRSVLRYTPIDIAGHPVPPPMRQPASDIPAGFSEDMRLSEHDIQAAVGMYNSSLGAPSNERTGKAITARQREGDVATFHYHDNLNRAIRHVGRILVDMIPRIYDTQRVVRIIGEDRIAEMAEVSQEYPQAVTRLGSKVIYNLGVGKYDVTVSAGASYTTLRQEAAEQMGALLQSSPEQLQVFGDLWMKNQDWPGAQEIAERLKLTLLPPIQEAERAKGQQSPEVAQMTGQMQQMQQQFQQIMQEMQAQMQELTSENEQLKGGLMVKAQETQIKGQSLQIDAYDAETRRIQALTAAQAKEQELDLKVREMVSRRLDELLAAQERISVQ